MTLLMILATYLFSIIISFIICRKCAIEAVDKFIDLVILIILLFIPIVNIIISVMLTNIYIYDDKKTKSLVKKIFFIKK